MSQFRRGLMKNWFAVEAIPIYVIIGGVMVGASWYLGRLALGPSVVWTKTNPTPWNTVKPDENTKLAAIDHKFEKRLTFLTLMLTMTIVDFTSSQGVTCMRQAMSTVFEVGYCVPVPQDGPDDLPVPGLAVTNLQGPHRLPTIIYGAATFCNFYNTNDVLLSFTPLRTVRLALRYGIRAFDTSVYYGNSEIVLGNILKALEPEFPRSSYQLMTKCGRYGQNIFDYSAQSIRESVKNSLRRLQTDYLDTVYLHDVEFVCTPVSPKASGNHVTALASEVIQYGLAEEDKGKIRGAGDQKVLDAISELRKLQDEGVVKNIGITGYPLPTLLRLAILVLHQPPYKPLDIVLSYCHLSLQNSTLTDFVPHFIQRAQVRKLVAASPLSMGLLSPRVPAWHPAPSELRKVVEECRDLCPMDLPNLALGFSMRHADGLHHNMPLVVGMGSPREVHECIKVWREVQEASGAEEREIYEEMVAERLRDAGLKDWSWASPA
ncbi:hypothetical protein AX15_002506 [Amanita polypyramis BW_CC]|nr:hypothetical protein AX15_002506 [Amanita polypyramis BW_CC]